MAFDSDSSRVTMLSTAPLHSTPKPIHVLFSVTVDMVMVVVRLAWICFVSFFRSCAQTPRPRFVFIYGPDGDGGVLLNTSRGIMLMLVVKFSLDLLPFRVEVLTFFLLFSHSHFLFGLSLHRALDVGRLLPRWARE